MSGALTANLLFLLVFSLTISLPTPNGFAQEKKKRISSEDLLKSRAGQFFREKKYEEALKEFVKLSEEYPDDPLIGRHIALSYQFTGKLDEAEAAFRQTIEKDPEDLQSRLSLANLYARQNRSDDAIREFEEVAERDTDALYGKQAREKLDSLKPKAEEEAKPTEEKQQAPEVQIVEGRKELTAQEFVSSEAAQLFRAGNYEEAVEAFEKMKKEFPESILILRYEGIAYHQLGKYDQAEQSFKTALALAPDNIATHFYLAETLLFQRRFKEAQAEYEFVALNDAEGRYAEPSKPRIEQLKKPLPEIVTEKPTAAKAKRWTLAAIGGYEYDGNVTFNSSDPRLRGTSDQNAGKYKSEIKGTYEIWKIQKNSVKGEYGYSQVLHDDGIEHLNTYSNTWGTSLTNVRQLFKKQLVLQFRDSLTHVVLNQRFFVFVNALTTSVIYQPHPRWQTINVYSFVMNEYDNNSANPRVSARDGFGHVVVFLNNFFLNKAKTLRITIGYDYQHDITNGDNFIRDVNGGRFAFHFPLFWKMEGEFFARYRHDDRPNFRATSLDGPRRDDVWELTGTLERRFGKQKRLRMAGFFTYNRAYSVNTAFEYGRPFGGVSVSRDF